MHTEIVDEYRSRILQKLNTLPAAHQKQFKRIYCREALDKALDEVIATIGPDRLETALNLVERSIQNEELKRQNAIKMERIGNES